MAAEDVKLIGTWANPLVVRARIALNLKVIKYEFLEEDPTKKSELLLKSNPVYKRFPVLIHGGKPICHSLFIVEYIDQVWSSSGFPILPADAYDRVTSLFWANYIDETLNSHIRELMWNEDEKIKAESKEKLFTALLLLEEAFVKCSKGKSFFGGDTINLVDISLGSYINWLKAIKIITGKNFLDKTKTPRLVEWAECFCSIEAVKKVLPEAEKLVEFRTFLKAKAASRAAADPSSK
ncbi:glutathione S-transferase U18-like [Dendrobium catenatum]|uniref:glutathione transferase n=1 Tax=Dendrobium catenatum TaxID=906689 RepID=A0A2I0VDL9_9ASPA|nr:glutathione S-transferase U18-like [Dendrobium catenatum]PKU61510.1 Glutathione S-transferase U18 [Dendrobium catenatum]